MSIKITKEEKFVDGVREDVEYVVRVDAVGTPEYTLFYASEAVVHDLLKALQEKLK